MDHQLVEVMDGLLGLGQQAGEAGTAAFQIVCDLRQVLAGLSQLLHHGLERGQDRIDALLHVELANPEPSATQPLTSTVSISVCLRNQ